MKQIKLFIETLRGAPITVPHESTSRRVCTMIGSGEIILEFYVNYDVQFPNYVSAYNLNPEEFDIEYTNESHDEIALYKGAEALEITAQQLHEIDCILETILY